MFITGTVVVVAAVILAGWWRVRREGTPFGTRFRVAGLIVCLLAVAAVSVVIVSNANAAIVPTVPLATSSNYAVLAGSTVTNTGNSVLNGSLGVAPGSSITGFPPGLVVAPGTTDANNPAAQQAQLDLTAGYNNAVGRAVNATTTADLANLNLQGGVYAGPGKGPLTLTGPLTLDGAGNPNTVFVFQSDSTLITAAASTVTLINGAQECNVFWQVGSSATLGATSVFSGNILALTSITVNNSATIRGRALARNGAVTLNNDTFIKPTCALGPPPTTTTQPGATTTTLPGATTTTLPGGTTTTTQPGATTTTTQLAVTTTTTAQAGGGTTTTTTTQSADTTTTTTPGITTTATPIPGIPSFTG